MAEREKAGSALVGAGMGGLLGAAIATLLAARPAAAVPENEKLDYLMELQTVMVQQIQRLVEIGEQVIGQVPIVLEPKIVPGLISVPLDPEVLNRAIQAVTPRGTASFGTIRTAYLCPAGTTTTMTIPMRPGWYCTRRDVNFSSDFYDPNIVVNVYVDNQLVTIWGIQLTGPGTLDFGDFYVKKEKVEFITVNNTATDALISAHWVYSDMQKSYYEEFYKPIVEYMYKSLEGVARGQV